ncbi:Abcc5, partial [Symbiodinium sp. CCMP2456]
LAPYTGSICVDGQPLRGLSEQVCGTLVAVVPQQPVLFSGTLRWNLDPALQFTDAQIWDAIKTVGLLRSCSGTLGLKADVQGSMSGSQTGSGALALSLGQRQLLCAARALLRSPKVALLDEVTAALPGELALSTVTHLVKKFRDINATTLLVTHQDDLVSVCDRTVRLSHGSVVSDTIAF